MRLIFLSVVFLWLLSSTPAYRIDDRDPAIQYSPTTGSSAWQQFSDSSAYLGTTTDNACVTAQRCQFSFSFTGSGVSFARYIITSIPIPLNAMVTLDGQPVPGILIQDGSPAVTVYSLQSISYGLHTMQVALVSYNSVSSHFRLDYIDVNETRLATTQPPAPPSTVSTTILPPTTSSPPPPSVNSKSKPTVAIAVGSAVGGVAFVGFTVLLLLRARGAKRASAPSTLDEAATKVAWPSEPPPNLPSNLPVASPDPSSATANGLVDAAAIAAGPASSLLAAHPMRPEIMPAPPFNLDSRYAIPQQTDPRIAGSSSGAPASQLSDDQVEYVAELYRQGVSAPDVARIMERIGKTGGATAASKV